MKIPTLLITLFFPLAAMAELPDVILMMSDDRGWEESRHNVHHPGITEQDFRGQQSFIVGDHKLVVRTRGEGEGTELFNLKDDPAETNNLAAEKPELVEELRAGMRQWQESVLHSLMGMDY